MKGEHESRVLLAILRERLDEAEALLSRRPVDPGAFLELCRRCDVHPWIHAVLDRRAAPSLLGPEVQDGLERLRAKVRADNLLLLARVEQALDALLGAGIAPVALKGLDTLHRFYATFDERTLDDADLLVAESDFSRAVSVLERAGWVAPPEPERTRWLRSSFQLPLRSPGPLGVLLEIHWSIGQQRRYRVDSGSLLARAQPLEVAGRRILRLHAHDAAAPLLVPHLQHYFDRRLKWTVDLRSLARQPAFEWRVVAERLREWDATVAGGFALLHVRKLLPEAAPDAALRALPVGSLRRGLALPLRSRHPLDFFRATRSRAVQDLLAALCFERPLGLAGYLWHRAVREGRPGGPAPVDTIRQRSRSE